MRAGEERPTGWSSAQGCLALLVFVAVVGAAVILLAGALIRLAAWAWT